MPASRHVVLTVGAVVAGGALLLGAAVLHRDLPGPVAADSASPAAASRLHNGWKITPAGARHETLAGDMPLGSALSPDGKTLALTSAGYNQHALSLLDTATGKLTQILKLGRAWNGVAWAGNDMVCAGGGASPLIHVFTRSAANGAFVAGKAITLPDVSQEQEENKGRAYVAGLAVSPGGNTLYAANIATDTVYALSLPDGAVKTKRTFADQPRPFCVRVGLDGLLYVTQWAAQSVVVLDPQTLATVRTLATGSHPNDIAFGSAQRVFVSCGNDDRVDVIDATTGATLETIRTTLTPGSPAGATPSALALSPDKNTLFVANSDNNAVAVIDVAQPGQSRVKGFVPTGWYPTVVCVSPDNKRLFVACGKGRGTRPNPVEKRPMNGDAPGGFPYIGTLLAGMISTLDLPLGEDKLAAFTRQVAANAPLASDEMIARPAGAPKSGASAIPSRVGEPSPIKHVLYIIKENRTYDQVLGDVKGGNGDPNLCLFGENITPNHHALARQFVLLDNVYCDGEVSADGHPWSTAGYVTDFTQRTWPASYGKKGAPPGVEKITVPPAGYIWDQCAKKGLSYRSYGEYVYAVGPDAVPGPLASSDGATGLKGHASLAWQRARGKRDYEKAAVFLAELKEFEQTGTLPRFMVMSLGEDHTSGTRAGAFTPKACVASNDLALGRIVEACTKSKYWPEMAIFVIEDDAQNGPDHVDAHRTVALAISPYTRRSIVDSTFYTTVSFLRTMELILGLPPLSQYDAGATPLYVSLASRPDLSGYAALPARIDLQAKNGAQAWGAKRTAAIDFGGYDHLSVDDEQALNRALWHSIKGANAPYPAPIKGALLAPSGHSVVGEEDED